MSKKTKIICTIGPASESKEVLTKLVEAGMNIARLNFSHGDYEEHAERVKRIREVSKETGKPIGILLDTKGPEIRLGDFENGGCEFAEGDEIHLYNILPIIISYCATPNKNGHVVNTSILFWNRNSNFPYLIQKAKIQRSQTIMLIILHNIIIHIL